MYTASHKCGQVKQFLFLFIIFRALSHKMFFVFLQTDVHNLSLGGMFLFLLLYLTVSIFNVYALKLNLVNRRPFQGATITNPDDIIPANHVC